MEELRPISALFSFPLLKVFLICPLFNYRENAYSTAVFSVTLQFNQGRAFFQSLAFAIFINRWNMA